MSPRSNECKDKNSKNFLSGGMEERKSEGSEEEQEGGGAKRRKGGRAEGLGG